MISSSYLTHQPDQGHPSHLYTLYPIPPKVHLSHFSLIFIISSSYFLISSSISWCNLFLPGQGHPPPSYLSKGPSLEHNKPCISSPGAPPLNLKFCLSSFYFFVLHTSIVFKALMKAICSFWNCSLSPFGRSGWVSFANLLKLEKYRRKFVEMQLIKE